MRIKYHIEWLLLAALLAGFNNQNTPAQAPANNAPKIADKKIQPKGPVADNSRCHVCHINFEEEDLAVVHARANIGCVSCHGDSSAHSSDEDNVTAPDIMYPRPKLNAACMKCHGRAKLSVVHQSVLAGKDPKNKYCIDCHGEHRVNHRTKNWDKETGKLLPLKPKTPSPSAVKY